MRKEGKCKQLRVSHQGLRQQDSKVAVWACLRKLPKGGVRMGRGKVRERHLVYISKAGPAPELGQSGKMQARPIGSEGNTSQV